MAPSVPANQNADQFFSAEEMAVGFVLVSALNNVTAAGSTQATATVLGNAQQVNVTTTPASTGVILPLSQAGAEIVIINNGANALLVYPAVGEKINALALNAGYSLAAAGIVILYCFGVGQWYTK